MSSNPTIRCLNCGASFQGNYCSTCGQAATVKKLSWKSITDELLHFFTHAEHSFFYTSRSLFTRPGDIVKEFLDGKRKKVHKPITLVLIWFAIYKLLGTGYDRLSNSLELDKLTQSHTSLRILWHGSKNTNLLQYENFISILIMAPLLVVLGWVVFRKTNTSFVERWVAILYGSAYTTIISIFLSSLGFIIKLFHAPVKTGFVNDLYFLVYYFAIAWFIYGFEKTFQPHRSGLQKMGMALLMSLIANYAADIVWYLLFWLIPA